MKKIGKKMLTGALIASFALGLGIVGAVHNQAFAAASTSNSASAQQSDRGWGGHGHGRGGHPGFGGSVEKETATILGVDQSAVEQARQGGKTLVAFAQEKGVSEADLLQKLVTAETTSINADVSAGKLTQDQAGKMLSGLSDRLTKQIESTEPPEGAGKGHGGRGPRGMGFGFGSKDTLTKVLGVTQDELKTQLDAGKSIADIAAAKGISEDDLISKIKDNMTDSIKKFVEDKHTSQQSSTSAASNAASN